LQPTVTHWLLFHCVRVDGLAGKMVHTCDDIDEEHGRVCGGGGGIKQGLDIGKGVCFCVV